MITAVIVDDEPAARGTLKSILDIYCRDVTLVGMAGSYEEALLLIEQTRPKLVFLDIQMPGRDGFDLATNWPCRESKIVFVSAHLNLGGQAYPYEPVYFLSKPLRITEVQKAVSKYHEAIEIEALRQSALQTNLEPSDSKLNLPDQLIVPDVTGFLVFPYDEIVFIEANGNYSKLHLVGGRTAMVSKLVKEIAAMLPSPRFLRVHRSYILQWSFVAKVSRSDRHPIVLRDGKEIPVSKDYMAPIRETFLGQWEGIG